MTVHATLHGSITDTGGENADERGFDYDYDSGAPYAGSWTQTDSYGVAAFSHQVTGLTEGVTVYFRAKAHNSAGWGYGAELSFVTPKAWSKILSENLGLLDKVAKAPALLKTEPLGLVDTYSRTWAVYRTYSEILGLSDTVIATRTLVKILTELLGLSDTVKKDASKMLTENLGLLDVYSRTWAAHKTYTELLGLADSIKKDIALHPLVEPLGLLDSVVKAPSITRDELLGLKDEISKDTSVTRTELLGLLDTIQKDMALHPLTETLGLLDTYTDIWTAKRTFTETLGLEDSVSKHPSKALVEVLGLLDSISYGKNLTVLAKLIRKFIQLESIGGGGER